jgi:imidazoleglycerol phosphate synthase glutamine amidotransferase subunit HisH
VGAFKDAMSKMKKLKLDKILKEEIKRQTIFRNLFRIPNAF